MKQSDLAARRSYSTGWRDGRRLRSTAENTRLAEECRRVVTDLSSYDYLCCLCGSLGILRRAVGACFLCCGSRMSDRDTVCSRSERSSVALLRGISAQRPNGTVLHVLR